MSVRLHSCLTVTTVVMFLFLVSCKHEPEEIIPVIPPPPDDTITAGISCNPDTAYFENDIFPILISSCAMSGCHDAATAQNGINLSSYQSIMSTADIIPGDPGNSELYEKITENDPEDRMPPPPMTALTTDQILSIRKWIEQGARNNYCDAGCDTTNFAFSTAIQPLINKNCIGCHNATTTSGGIRLDSYASVKSVADNGSLYGAVSHQLEYSPMPKGGNQLPECNIIQIRKWIEAGAPND